VRILFWNIQKKKLKDFVCLITASTEADIVVLAEDATSDKETLLALQTNVSQDFYRPGVITKSGQRFHCFCRNLHLDLSETHKTKRTSVRNLHIGNHNILLVLVHGIDIRNNDSNHRQLFAKTLADELKFLQEEKRTNKFILLGDFNMNPYEDGMITPLGLNAMMAKACVKRGFRTFLGKKYDFYYNPMWSLFGDNTNGPPGTIYNTSNQGPYGWSMLDQVIIHHSIVGLFDSVKILTEAGAESIVSSMGHPDVNKASDHFPILVNFREDNNE